MSGIIGNAPLYTPSFSGDVSSSGNLDLGNQSTATTTLINFHSNGTTYDDITLQVSGGSSSASHQGTLEILGGTISFVASSVDMSGSTSVLVPTLSAVDSSTKAASTAYVSEYYLQNNNAGITGSLNGTSLVWDNTNNYPFFAYDNNTSGMSLATRLWTEDNYLPLTGGTLTGALTLDEYLKINGTSSQTKNIALTTNQEPRWFISSAGEESGSNVGGDLQISRWSDEGDFIGLSFQITRSTGVVTFGEIPVSVTPSSSDNSTNVATTAFVHSLVSSDPSLKENMVELSNNKSLTDLSKVKLYSFGWKDKERGYKEVGFNSKNLLQVWPDVVNQFKPNKDGIAPPDSIDVVSLIARLTDCIKELNDKVTHLESKVDKPQT